MSKQLILKLCFGLEMYVILKSVDKSW